MSVEAKGIVEKLLQYYRKQDSFNTSIVRIKPEMARALTQFSEKNQLNLGEVLTGAWLLLLERYNNSDDFIIEKINAGVIQEITVKLEGQDSINSIFKQLSNKGLFEPGALIRNKSNGNVSIARGQIYFAYSQEEFLDLEAISDFDFFLLFDCSSKKLSVHLISNRGGDLEVLAHSEIEKHVYRILGSLYSHGESRLNSTDLLSNNEEFTLPLQIQLDNPRGICQVFEEQVERSPTRIAIADNQGEITYKELNKRSNQFAWHLRDQGIGSGDVVAIAMNRTIDFIVAVLGVLKVIGICLPIDKAYPKERIEYYIRNSQAKCIIVDSDKEISIPIECIRFADVYNRKLALNNPSTPINPEMPAYLIYTSGSTGEPKGVVLHHAGIINHAFIKIDLLEMTEDDVVAHNLSMNFVASIWKVVAPLFVGGKVVIIDSSVMADPYQLMQEFKQQKVTIVELIPSSLLLYLEMISSGFDKLTISTVRRFILTGEEITPQLVNLYYSHYKIPLVNAYGQSECSDDTLHYKIPYSCSHQLIPIGQASHNTQIYILDRHSRIQPDGIPGELYISGQCLAKGYLFDAENTEKKFVPHFLDFGRKMYRTGDLVKRLADGNIQFIGRIDNQVKIRGYRIELGEIEAVFRKVEEIADIAVVMAKNNQESYLAAFVILRGELNSDTLRQEIKKRLPEVMVPTLIKIIKAFPLTPNGKVDRQKLTRMCEDLSAALNMDISNEDKIDLTEQCVLRIVQKVLNNPSIRLGDNFLEVGGHSLKVTSLLIYLQKELCVKLKFSDIFKSKSIGDIAQLIKRSAATNQSKEIERMDEAEFVSLSSPQMKMFILNQFDEARLSYHLPECYEFKGSVDVEKLEKALYRIVERHEILRTSFEIIDGLPMQRIHSECKVKVLVLDSPDKDLNKLLEMVSQPFVLSNTPLFQVGLWKSEEESILLFNFHHIVFDGLSSQIMMDELSRIYEGNHLDSISYQYKDFVSWQKRNLADPSFKDQEQYWIDRYSAEIPVLNLNTDFKRPSVQEFKGERLLFEISNENAEKLKAFSTQTSNTIFTVLYSAFCALIWKYSGQTEFVIGVPISVRNCSEFDCLLGMFVNTLPIHNEIRPDYTISDFVDKIKLQLIEAFDNQDVPFENIVDKLKIGRDLSRNPMFDIVFVLNSIIKDRIWFGDMPAKAKSIHNKTSKFDMTFEVQEVKSSRYTFSIEYSTSLFKKNTIERLGGHYLQVLDAFLNTPDQKLSEIDILTEAERKQLLVDFNQTQASYPSKTLCKIFEEQVEKTPNNVAVVMDNQELTYEELNCKANQLARKLVDMDVSSESIVAIMADRSLEMIIGIIAIMKAGGAYMPIDPDFPIDRIEFMTEDSKITAAVTMGVYKGIFGSIEHVICLDDPHIFYGVTNNLPSRCNPDNLAYIIYTSGSTGKPKGVMIEHRNVVRLLLNNKNLFNSTSHDIWSIFHSFCFDFSVWEMYGALLNGGKAVVVPKHVAQYPEDFRKLLKEQKVTILSQTPTAFYNLSIEEMNHAQPELLVRKVIFGGEALSPIQLNNWYQRYPKTLLINMYGITETTVHSTYKEITELEILANQGNIGSAIPTLKIYIMDQNKQLVPIGITGEIYISGDGVARGYLNRDDLNRERFISDIFNEGTKLYKSGDLAFWLENGEIEYVGRMDHQVKIRGYRIELGEIETQLLKYETIREVFVSVRIDANGNKFICAYYSTSFVIEASYLRDFLSKSLPQYMIPSFFVYMDSFPLTSNGKINKVAFPAPEEKIVRKQIEPALNEAQAYIIEIWEEVLGIKLGINDNFFEMGGDSIKAIQVLSKMQKISLKSNLKDLFRYPTIKSISEHVKYEEDRFLNEVVTGETFLTPIQKWFFEKDFSDRSHWNQSIMLQAKGRFSEDIVRKVFAKIVEHHDILRSIFLQKEETFYQFIRPLSGLPFPLFFCMETFDLISQNNYRECIETEVNKAQCSMNLEQGPLIQLRLFKTKEGDHLFIVIHHLVVDGVSWRIILEDFQIGYHQLMNGEEIRFQGKTTSYQQWAREIYRYAGGDRFLLDQEYWKSLESIDVEPLPKDYEVIEKNYQDTVQLKAVLEEDATKIILTRAQKALTMEINDILLTAFGNCVSQWTGQQNVAIYLEGHGREDTFEEVNITRTVGWFTSIFPVVLNFHHADLKALLQTTKRVLNQVPQKGLTYGIIKYIAPSSYRMHYSKLKPEILFNYLGQFDQTMNTDLFSKSILATGIDHGPENIKEELLEVECIVMDGKLNLMINYNRLMYKEETIKGLLSNFLSNLKQIVSLVSNQRDLLKEGGDTSSYLEEKTLSPIHPFNDFFYRDCFYNALFPALTFYGKSILPILINEVPVYTQGKDMIINEPNFVSVIELADVLKNSGLILRKRTVSVDDLVQELINSIRIGNPIILGMDCYYEPIRQDMYLKHHWSHNLLVFGYDIKKQLFRIIEHKMINSLTYQALEIPFTDIVNSYSGFLTHFYHEKDSPSFYEIVPDRMWISENVDLFSLFLKNISMSKKLLEASLKRLYELQNQLRIILLDQKLLDGVIDEVMYTLVNISYAKKVEKFKVTALGFERSTINLVEDLVDRWSIIVSIINKYKMSNVYRNESFLELLECMEEASILEERYYNELFYLLAKGEED